MAITDEVIEIILACRKSILADNRRTWVKSHMDNFDVPHGRLRLGPGSRLNRDFISWTRWVVLSLRAGGADGIIFILDSNDPNTSKIPKKITRAFKLLSLRMEIGSNFKIVDFLAVTLNLDNGTFKPFSKSNSTPTYINIDSNHPRSILK